MANTKEKTAAAKEKKSPKDSWVEVTVFSPDGEPEERFVGVNGKNYQVRCNQPVMVPPEVAEVLRHSDLQMVSARENQKRFENQCFAEFGEE